MKKLSLDLDSLSVDSFATVAGKPAGTGTVHGNATGLACPVTSGIKLVLVHRVLHLQLRLTGAAPAG